MASGHPPLNGRPTTLQLIEDTARQDKTWAARNFVPDSPGRYGIGERNKRFRSEVCGLLLPV